MDIVIDPLSPVPIYQQVRDRIVEAIAAGYLVRGDALQSVRTLARAFGINPATVAKAYETLRGEGLVGTNAKSGTFVAADRDRPVATPELMDDWRARLFTLLAEGRAKGLPPQELTAACARAIDAFDTDAPPRKE